MKSLKWINAGAFTAMIAVNALANLLPIGGKTTGQISETYPNLFTPAPITFAIWGMIYLLMLLFTIYQFGITDHDNQSSKVRERIGYWFTISCVLNIMWIFFWHFQLIGLSTICIALLLLSLLMIVKRLQSMNSTGFLQRIMTNTGFSLYYGWIIAATIANISVFLTKAGWNGWGISADFWTVVVLLVGAVIVGAVAIFGRDWIAPLAVMWAYCGILIRHISPVYYGGTHPYVIVAGFVCEAVVLAAIVLPKVLRKCWKRSSVACR